MDKALPHRQTGEVITILVGPSLADPHLPPALTLTALI